MREDNNDGMTLARVLKLNHIKSEIWLDRCLNIRYSLAMPSFVTSFRLFIHILII